MSPPDRHVPLIYVDELDAPQLSDADERHLRASLRMTTGDRITVGDGAGRHRPARLVAESGVVADGEIESEAEPDDLLTIAFTPVKAQKAEWLVTKLTEIGADVIIPLRAERSVVRWDDKRAAKMAGRFEQAAREAGIQSRRSRLPRIEPLSSVTAIRNRGAVLAEPGGAEPGPDTRFIAIGPEGGWSPAEVDGAATVLAPRWHSPSGDSRRRGCRNWRRVALSTRARTGDHGGWLNLRSVTSSVGARGERWGFSCNDDEESYERGRVQRREL